MTPTPTGTDEEAGRDEELAKHIKLADQIHRAPGRFTKNFVIRAFANAADAFGALLDERGQLRDDSPLDIDTQLLRADRDSWRILANKATARAEQAEAKRDFAWGQSIGLNGAASVVDIPFNDGDRWVGNVVLGVDDARVLHDMLGGLLDEIGARHG